MIFRRLEIKFECQKEALAVARRYSPPQVVTVLEVEFNKGIGYGLELYQGNLNYGEYNRKVKDLYTTSLQAITQINAEIAKQKVDALARAEQLATQQQQLYFNYLNNYNNYMVQRQQQLPQVYQRGTIRCSHLGEYTYCNY